MPTPNEVTQIAVRHGRDKKRNNAIAAVLCGVLPAAALSSHPSSNSIPFHPWSSWLIGVTVGLIWGNAFEYVYHRWLLHESRGRLGVGHRQHHAQIGTPEQAEYVALITSPLNIVFLFVINGIPAVLISSLIGSWGVLPGVFIGWASYLIMTEEIHWRIHMGGWLPPGLRFARAYHMSHHARPNSRYNVFLPLFDFLFGNMRQGKTKVPV
ncbi:MAG TPA: sterol desaturase family protein [Verrucomicrobiae bacterium]|nr:sterol desaturase family protein [Verrucomicrobiae bacterium]